MSGLSAVLERVVFPLEYALSCAVFLIPLKKKRDPLLRLILAILVLPVLEAVLVRAIPWLWPIWFGVIVFIFLIGVQAFLLCADLSLWDAVFGAACAYALQHFCYSVYYCVVIHGLKRDADPLLELAVFFFFAPLAYLLVSKKLPVNGRYQVGWLDAVGTLALIFFFAFYLSMVAENICRAQPEEANRTLLFIIRLYAMLCCSFALWVQISLKSMLRARLEAQIIRLLSEKQRQQYELSRANIDLINRKCHDLKHQVRALRKIQSETEREERARQIEASVTAYDAMARTGNEVLDTILTERALECEQEGIVWTCLADGRGLESIDAMDLYSMMGNALDNSMESVRKLSDPEKKMICVTISPRAHMSVLQVENYYEGTIRFEGGLPRTSKEEEDYHGFGLSSIRATAEKYGGALSLDARGSVFTLCILLPHGDGRIQPEKREVLVEK